MENNNFLKAFHKRKENFMEYAKKALEYSWISQEEYNDYINKIQDDRLTIGVIGQMKCGKSTFLNALVFQDEKLPAATTPMTASLSVITYGEKESLEVEFYSKDDWEELKYRANEPIENASESRQKEIQAAQELIESAKKTPNIESLLGSKKQDSIDNLIEYVGAGGKYTPITLSVKIKYPLEYLKGVEIVDTPGFNDPIVSREERTKEFLKKADAVVFLLGANRAFDATDKNVILKTLREVGIGKMLIGINKYDLCISGDNPETEEEILENIKKQLIKTSREDEWRESPIATLLEQTEPLLLSANLALMAQMPLSKVQDNFYYKKAIADFEFQNQKQMYEVSKMQAFEEALKEHLIKAKDEILLAKPKNSISQKGELKLNDLTTLIDKLENENKTASLSKEEAQKKQKQVQKGIEDIEEAIDDFGYEVKNIAQNPIRALVRNVEDIIQEGKISAKNKIETFSNNSIFNWKGDEREEKLKRDIEDIYEDTKKSLSRKYEDEICSINEQIEGETKIFLRNLEKILKQYFEDFKSKGLERELKNYFKEGTLSISQKEVFSYQKEEYTLGEVLFYSVLTPLVLPFFALGMGNDINKEDYIIKVKGVFEGLMPQGLKESISSGVATIVKNIKTLVIDKTLNPISKQLQERIDEVATNTQKIEENKQKIAASQKHCKDLEQQITEMKALAQQI